MGASVSHKRQIMLHGDKHILHSGIITRIDSVITTNNQNMNLCARQPSFCMLSEW